MIKVSDILKIIGRGNINHDNVVSVHTSLVKFGKSVGLDKPHRLAYYLGQILHESAGMMYDSELWGPTPAQARYDTRTDLGNTPEKDGDGYKYRGRTAIQITGKSNYRLFTAWCRKMDRSAPDFERNPDLVNTDPWEGAGPIWFWSTRGLNDLADGPDALRRITKRINGGYNGLKDRQMWTDRASLVILGYDPGDVRGFQIVSGLVQDGKLGPVTRQTIHDALVRQGKSSIVAKKSVIAMLWSWLKRR